MIPRYFHQLDHDIVSCRVFWMEIEWFDTLWSLLIRFFSSLFGQRLYFKSQTVKKGCGSGSKSGDFHSRFWDGRFRFSFQCCSRLNEKTLRKFRIRFSETVKSLSRNNLTVHGGSIVSMQEHSTEIQSLSQSIFVTDQTWFISRSSLDPFLRFIFRESTSSNQTLRKETVLMSYGSARHRTPEGTWRSPSVTSKTFWETKVSPQTFGDNFSTAFPERESFDHLISKFSSLESCRSRKRE